MGKRKTGPLREPEVEVAPPKENKKRSRFDPVSSLNYETLQERATELENDVQQVRRALERLKGSNATLYGNTEAKILNNRLRKAETAYGEVQRELVRRVQQMQGNGANQMPTMQTNSQLLRLGVLSGAMPGASQMVMPSPAISGLMMPAAFRGPVAWQGAAASGIMPISSSLPQVPSMGVMSSLAGSVPLASQQVLPRFG